MFKYENLMTANYIIYFLLKDAAKLFSSKQFNIVNTFTRNIRALIKQHCNINYKNIVL